MPVHQAPLIAAPFFCPRRKLDDAALPVSPWNRVGAPGQPIIF
jgi:hypothetical protein